MKYQIDGIPISLDSFTAELINSWCIFSPSSVLIQTGVLDTLEKTEAFFKAIQGVHLEWKRTNPHLKIPLRLMDGLLCLQKEEWDLITAQDLLMAWFLSQKEFPGQCALLNLPTEHFYQPKDQQPESEFFLKAAAKLSDLLNVKGWGTYCKWINEEITLILQNIPLESMDSYTLEALFKNFNHEIDSQLLRNLEKEIQEVQLKVGGLYELFQHPCEASATIISLEKIIIKARSEIRRLLKFQYDTLEEIARIIPIIEESHPNFTSFKNKAFILNNLIKNHLEIPEAKTPSRFQELMLLQLLNEELGVLTVINSGKGLGRPSLATAVMLTISLLKQNNPLEKLIDLALDWNQTAREVNKKIAHLGPEQFNHWLSNPSRDEHESIFKHSAHLVIKFRQIFLEVLEKIGSSQAKQAGTTESQKINTEYALLLPIYEASKNKLVLLDEEGNVTGLTKAGHALMTQLVLL
jgi:hypothetical protein